MLEKHGTRLGSRSLLSQLIPVVLAKEKDTIKSVPFGQSLSIVFDGSTRLAIGEAVVVVVRYVDHNWKIRQVLAWLAVLSKSLTGDQLIAELNNVISTTLQVRKYQIMAIMRDGASVNGAAMRVFRDLYPSFIDITCFARTIDRVGVYFELSTLDRFMNWWAQRSSLEVLQPSFVGSKALASV